MISTRFYACSQAGLELGGYFDLDRFIRSYFFFSVFSWLLLMLSKVCMKRLWCDLK